jgi:hypothetical protein
MDTDTIVSSAPVETHLETAMKLNNTLEKALRSSEEENERLRSRISQYEALKILVFGSREKMSVSFVSSSTPEGEQSWNDVVSEFILMDESLKKKGIRWHVVGPVMVDQLHEVPFRTSNSQSTASSSQIL